MSLWEFRGRNLGEVGGPRGIGVGDLEGMSLWEFGGLEQG